MAAQHTIEVNGNTYPLVDDHYRMVHASDSPFFMYPDEKYEDVGDYIITSYHRIYSKKRQDFVRSVPGIYVPTFIREHWPEDVENNPCVKANLTNSRQKRYYVNNKEKVRSRYNQHKASRENGPNL